MTAQAGDTFPDSMLALRAQLRSRLRQQRRQLPPELRQRAPRTAATRLLRSAALRGARHIAVYLASPVELDTAPLIERLHRRGCHLYAPVVQHHGEMHWIELPPRHTRGLRRDAKGLRCPSARRPRRLARQLDAVIMPLLGFDEYGSRLGTGGGFYDRAFAFRRHCSRPKLIGYAFAAQQVDRIPVEPWDVPLDAIVTEREFLRRRR